MSKSLHHAVSSFVAWQTRVGGKGLFTCWLAGFLLVMQLAGVGTLTHPGIQPLGEYSAALDAAIGHPVPICLQMDRHDPLPSTPAHDHHCGVCCLLTADLVLASAEAFTFIPHATVVPVVSALAPETSPAHPRLAGGASPRGPPTRV